MRSPSRTRTASSSTNACAVDPLPRPMTPSEGSSSSAARAALRFASCMVFKTAVPSTKLTSRVELVGRPGVIAAPASPASSSRYDECTEASPISSLQPTRLVAKREAGADALYAWAYDHLLFSVWQRAVRGRPMREHLGSPGLQPTASGRAGAPGRRAPRKRSGRGRLAGRVAKPGATGANYGTGNLRIWLPGSFIRRGMPNASVHWLGQRGDRSASARAYRQRRGAAAACRGRWALRR